MQQWVICPVCGKRLIEKKGFVLKVEPLEHGVSSVNVR